MNKLLKIALMGALGVALATSSASASVKKGQKLYAKKLKKVCGFNGAEMAAKHTQDEWEDIGVDGLKDEIKKFCPNATDKQLKDKFMKHYYDFFYNYASDSGNVPSC